MIAKVSNFRDILADSKEKLDKSFENGLFWGLSKNNKDSITSKKIKNTIQMAT